MDERLRLVAELQNRASVEIRRITRDLEGVKPNNGMLQAQKWFDTFRATGDKTATAIRPVGMALSTIGVGGLAAGLSITGLVRQFRELADSTATLKELGRESGIATTEIARLQYAASQLHVDPAKMAGAIDTWSGKMVEFRRHTGIFYTELLRQNGDVANKIAADSPIQGLKDTLDFLSRIKDPQVQKRWADSMGLQDLVPMLAKGPQGLADAYAAAAREVKPITPELEAQAEALNQSLARFDQTWANFKREVGPTVLNGLTETVDKLDLLFKAIHDHPTEALIGAGGAAAMFARHRLMQRFSGGGAGLNRAAGNLTGAAGALKEAAAELRGRGGGPGGGGPGGGEEAKKSGNSNSYLRARTAMLGFNLFSLVQGMPDALKDAENDKEPAPKQQYLGDNLRDGWRWLTGSGSGDLTKATQDGSKAGIIAGLREVAQQQDLDRGGPGIGSDGGAPSLRYGRGAGGRYRSAPGTQGGAPLGQGAQGGTFKGGRTPQAGLAKESYDFWRGKGLDHNAALSMVAQEQGESGFDFRNKSGDGGSAHGAFQWHADRRAAILRGTGINIDNADHKQQLEAAWYEGTKGERAGFFQSLNGRSLPDAVHQGVHRFEGSANQMADSAKRLGFARAWDGGGSFLAPPSAAGPNGAFPGWMDAKSRRELAGVNAPLAKDLLAASQATGAHFRVLQGLRTQAEADGNARRGVGVRNSQHLYGAAADIKLTDASGHDLDRSDPAYEKFANAYEAHSRAAGGKGRWLGHAGGGWSWDRAHFDQGIGYGQSHARNPYGAGGPTKDDINAGNREIFNGPDNPFLKAAKPLGTAAQKLSEAVKPLPSLVQLARGPEIDPVEIHIRHHDDGRARVTARGGQGTKLSIRSGPTMQTA